MANTSESDRLNAITEKIIGAAIRVHEALGPGILESAYEANLTFELIDLGFAIERQKSLPVVYLGRQLDCGYRIGLLVEQSVIVEVKSIERLERVHSAQVLSYLRLTKLKVRLLINFNVPWLRGGIKRIVNAFPE
jgi:GxxExxY protein